MTVEDIVRLASTHADFRHDLTPFEMAKLARHQDRVIQGEQRISFGVKMPLRPENQTICEYPLYQVITFSDGTKLKFNVDGSFYKPDLFERWLDWFSGKK